MYTIFFRVFYKRSNCHQSLYFYVLKSDNFMNKIHNFLWHQTEFCIFFCHVYFEKHIYNNTFFRCFFINCFRKTNRINRMDQLCLIDDIFYFVALQMTNHLPVNILRHYVIFFIQFLHFIFTKITATVSIRFFQHFYRFGLADSNQCYILPFSAGAFACSAYTCFHIF